MTELIFSFDTEDPVHEEGADGILRSAELLSEAGVVGCYNTVGVLAKALKEWGREDVIEAMKKHEIDIHTNRHTFHPDVNEYTDLCIALLRHTNRILCNFSRPLHKCHISSVR